MERRIKASAKRRKRRNQRKRMFLMGGVALGAILILLLAGYLILRGQVNKVAADTICNNIYIEDVDVSGMNAKKAKKAIEEQIAAYHAMTVELSVEEQDAEVTLEELGFDMKRVDALVKEAVAYGKDGSLLKRYRMMKALEDEKKVYEVTYSVDEEVIEQTLAEKFPHLENEAKDASIVRENGSFVITDEVKGIMIDVETSTKTIEKYFNKEWNKTSGAIVLDVKEGQPQITRADLETIQDVLGSFTTYCGYGGGRVQNIKTGAKHINGALLMPGEEYSANAAMEPYTEENGFAEAGSYENGKVVQSMGGGICQVSSTLYNAIILAEVEIVERAAHSMLVSYVEPSMDAAIAGDFKDLKFKNNKETPIYIEGYVENGNVIFNIYGKETRSEDREVKFEHEVVSSTPAGKKFVATGDAVGTLKKGSSGYDGMKAKLWKIIYENGVEVERKVANNSTYRKSEAVWNVGTSSDNAQAAKLVKDAVATQDEAKIKSAIEQAKKLIEEANKPAVTPPDTTS